MLLSNIRNGQIDFQTAYPSCKKRVEDLLGYFKPCPTDSNNDDPFSADAVFGFAFGYRMKDWPTGVDPTAPAQVAVNRIPGANNAVLAEQCRQLQVKYHLDLYLQFEIADTIGKGAQVEYASTRVDQGGQGVLTEFIDNYSAKKGEKPKKVVVVAHRHHFDRCRIQVEKRGITVLRPSEFYSGYDPLEAQPRVMSAEEYIVNDFASMAYMSPTQDGAKGVSATMQVPKPTDSERQALLNDAFSSLDEVERDMLFKPLDVLFESVLTYDALLHVHADNPIEHHTTVLKQMMTIAKGEGFSWDDLRRAAAIAILHDMQPSPKITRAMRDAAKTPAQRAELDLKNIQNRVIHMGVGSHRARGKLADANTKLGQAFFTDADIDAICAVVAIHDIPSIDLPIPGNARMAVAFREADRLWMQTEAGVLADLARKDPPVTNPTEQQCVDQAKSNLKSYRKERELYDSQSEKFCDDDTFFRTSTGYIIFERLRLDWQKREGTI
jgi:hypothetical protein